MTQTLGKYVLLDEPAKESSSVIQVISSSDFVQMEVVLVGPECPDTIKVGDLVLVNQKKCSKVYKVPVEGRRQTTYSITNDLEAILLKF